MSPSNAKKVYIYIHIVYLYSLSLSLSLSLSVNIIYVLIKSFYAAFFPVHMKICPYKNNFSPLLFPVK